MTSMSCHACRAWPQSALHVMRTAGTARPAPEISKQVVGVKLSHLQGTVADAKQPLAGIDTLPLDQAPPLKGLDLSFSRPVTPQAQDDRGLLSPPAKFPGSTEAPFAENSVPLLMPITCQLRSIFCQRWLHSE